MVAVNLSQSNRIEYEMRCHDCIYCFETVVKITVSPESWSRHLCLFQCNDFKIQNQTIKSCMRIQEKPLKRGWTYERWLRLQMTTKGNRQEEKSLQLGGIPLGSNPFLADGHCDIFLEKKRQEGTDLKWTHSYVSWRQRRTIPPSIFRFVFRFSLTQRTICAWLTLTFGIVKRRVTES